MVTWIIKLRSVLLILDPSPKVLADGILTTAILFK